MNTVPTFLFSIPLAVAALVWSAAKSLCLAVTDGINGETAVSLALAIPAAIAIGRYLYQQGQKDRQAKMERRAMTRLLEILARQSKDVDDSSGEVAELLRQLRGDERRRSEYR